MFNIELQIKVLNGNYSDRLRFGTALKQQKKRSLIQKPLWQRVFASQSLAKKANERLNFERHQKRPMFSRQFLEQH